MGRFNRVAGSPGPVDALLNVADMGMRLYGQKQQAAADAAKQAQQQRIDDIEYGTGDPATRGMYQTDANMGGVTDMSNYQPGLKERKVMQTDTTNRLANDKFQASEQSAKRQFEKHMTGDFDIGNMINTATALPGTSLDPAFNSVKEMFAAGKIKTRWDAYQHLKGQEAFILESSRQRAMKEIEADIKNGRNLDAKNKAELLKTMRPGFIESFFGFPKEMIPDQKDPNLSIGWKPDKPDQPKLYATEEGYLPYGKAEGKMPFRQPVGGGMVTVRGYDKDGNPVIENLPKTEGATSPGKIKSFNEPVRTNMTPSEKRSLQKDLADAEAKILGSKDEPGVAGYIDLFNQSAKTPYMYYWDSKSFDEMAKRLDIPKTKDGRQFTAADVVATEQKRGWDIERVFKFIETGQ